MVFTFRFHVQSKQYHGNHFAVKVKILNQIDHLHLSYDVMLHLFLEKHIINCDLEDMQIITHDDDLLIDS